MNTEYKTNARSLNLVQRLLENSYIEKNTVTVYGIVSTPNLLLSDLMKKVQHELKYCLILLIKEKRAKLLDCMV